MAFGGPAEVLDPVQPEWPMLAVDKDEIEVELAQNVDHPWGWEGKVVAVRLGAGAHGGFHSVGLLHPIPHLCGDYDLTSHPIGLWVAAQFRIGAGPPTGANDAVGES